MCRPRPRRRAIRPAPRLSAAALAATLAVGLAGCNLGTRQLEDVPEVEETETLVPGDTPANEADRPDDEDGEPLTEE